MARTINQEITRFAAELMEERHKTIMSISDVTMGSWPMTKKQARGHVLADGLAIWHVQKASAAIDLTGGKRLKQVSCLFNMWRMFPEKGA